MNRLLYEKSVFSLGYLIIPFVSKVLQNRRIYSYKLLSDRGWKGTFHKGENPAGLYCDSLEEAIAVAQEHLEIHSDSDSPVNTFKERYIYQNNFFILYEEGGKCFYDHYSPDNLNNIAAPKIFKSKVDCISWITRELTRRTPEPDDRRSIR
ncbi:MAG: hypothetical protein WBC69_20570 [Geitlerinemataceae cyanobacterium]